MTKRGAKVQNIMIIRNVIALPCTERKNFCRFAEPSVRGMDGSKEIGGNQCVDNQKDTRRACPVFGEPPLGKCLSISDLRATENM